MAFQGADQVQMHASQSTGSKAFTALAFQRKTAAVSHVLAAQANTEHAVFLQFQELNAQKIAASRGRLAFKSQYFKG